MLEDLAQDIKDIKNEVVILRIESERSKTTARVAWMAFTFFIGISGYFLRDYATTTIDKVNQNQITISHIQQDVAIIDNRVGHLETLNLEKYTKRVSD